MPGPFVLVQQDVPLLFPVSHCMQSHDRRYTVQKTAEFTFPFAPYDDASCRSVLHLYCSISVYLDGFNFRLFLFPLPL